MKKLLLGSVLLVGLMSVTSAKSYECKRYVNGKYQGWVKIKADNESEAVRKGYQKFKDIGKKVDTVKCNTAMFF